MADDVQITVGVALQNLASGIEQAKGQLSEFASSIKAAISAFAVYEINNFVESMAEMGTQAERTAAMLGISTSQAQLLRVESLMVGGSADSLNLQLSRLAVGIQRGVVPMSQQSQALKDLGLNARSLIGLPLPELLNRVADAAQRVGPGLRLTTDLTALGGRGMAQLIPYLVQGAAGFSEMAQRAKDAGAIVGDTTIKALEGLHQNLVLVKSAFTALGETIVGALSRPLGDAATSVSNFVGAMNAVISGGLVWKTVFETIRYELTSLGIDLERIANIIQDVFMGAFAKIPADIRAGADKQAEELNRYYTNLDGIVQEGKAKLNADMAAGPAGGGGSQLFGAAQAARDAQRVADEVFRQQVQQINELRDLYEITEGQKTTMLIEAARTRMNAEIAAGASVAVAHAKFAAEEAKDNTELTKKIMTDWKSLGDTISSAFTGQLNAMLAGTESFGEGMKKAFASMVESMIASLIKLFLEWLTLNAISVALGGGPIPFSAVMPTLTKAEAGSMSVPQTGLALVHEGEAIIPAMANPFNASNTGGVGGTTNNFAGTGVTLNVSAVDAASFASLLRRYPNIFAPALDRLAQRGALSTLMR